MLFYPCAGADFTSAIETFIATVDSFWFVDDAAYQRRVPRLKGYWKPVPLDDMHVAGAEVRRFELTSAGLGKTVEVNFASGDSQELFASLIEPDSEHALAIFYYRGDSCGEGGSGRCWLSGQGCHGEGPGLLSRVLTAIQKPGLIATDGSNGHDGFRKFHEMTDATVNAHRQSATFIAEGFRLTPIGTAGMRYGPTVIWEVTCGDE